LPSRPPLFPYTTLFRSRERGLEPLLACVLEEVEGIFALEWISAGDDEDARLEERDLVDQLVAFLGCELELAPSRLRGRTAVNACEIARPCVLPDDDEGTLVEVDCAAHRTPMLRAQSRYATGEISEGLISARP